MAKPLALVSTVTPLIVAVFTVRPGEVPPAPVLDGAPAAPPGPVDELPHAVTISATATRAAGASRPIRPGCPSAPRAGRLRPGGPASRTRPGQEVSCSIVVSFSGWLFSGWLFSGWFTRRGPDAVGGRCAGDDVQGDAITAADHPLRGPRPGQQ